LRRKRSSSAAIEAGDMGRGILAEIVKDKNIGTSRRNFLKGSGLAVVGSTLAATTLSPGVAAESTAPTGESSTAINEASGAKFTSPVDAVNVLQGTDSTPAFSRGNTLPIAALPFGMAHWTLQSAANTPWMFSPGVRRIQGLRCTHQLSPWLDDYGHAIFLPFCGETNPEAGARASSYRPEDAKLTPYSFELFLLRYRAKVELIPTERCCLLTAEFENSDGPKIPGLAFDVPGKTSVIKEDRANRRILFTSMANAGGVPENFAAYYVLQFAETWESFDVKPLEGKEPGHQVGVVRFKAGAKIETRIATSFISFEQAQLNLKNELGGNSAATLREAGKARWNEYMHRIDIEGATEKQYRTFYSCMYRALLFPRTFHEPDAAGKMQHYSAFNGKVEPGLMYADHGYWDVYRAWYPFMSIVFPEKLGEILQAWVNAYKEGGWLPQFPAPGYRACMTGSLIDSIFGDAAVKGIEGFDLLAAYEGLKKHATMKGNPDGGYGRVGIEDYLKFNYLPADRIEQSVAETVDAAYGDFCIAQVAKAAGKEDDAKLFLRRSENWRNLFDPSVKFLRGKNADGTWLTPFDPFTWGSPYVEGSAWQHRWDAPHDVAVLMAAMGGKAASAEALEKMVTVPPIFNVGVYGQEIHEMSEMAAVVFGQYAHSNQPSHNMLYLFAHAGRADRTQYWVRKVMDELYSPEMFAGDEDTGSMAAWYILSAMGFYPVCPGKPEYTLGSPLFLRATINLPGKKAFTIDAPGNSAEKVYVRSAHLDGQPIAGITVEHAAITKGGTLRFEMSAAKV
jgi:predicted alpha-1,2-mannosidase